MKVYLAEHPGKTNKDAMKHVCLPFLSTFLIPYQIFRSARFGKMHQKIQRVAKKSRRRTPKLRGDRRKEQQRSQRVMTVPRLSLAAMNERSQVLWSSLWSILLRRLRPFGTYYCLFQPRFLACILFCLHAHPYYCCPFSKRTTVDQC